MYMRTCININVYAYTYTHTALGTKPLNSETFISTAAPLPCICIFGYIDISLFSGFVCKSTTAP